MCQCQYLFICFVAYFHCTFTASSLLFVTVTYKYQDKWNFHNGDQQYNIAKIIYADDINIILQWLNAGCVIQVDAGSLIGKLGKRSFNAAKGIVERGWCQIIGSDTHDDKFRNFYLDEALSKSIELLGAEAKKMVFDTSSFLIRLKKHA